MLGHFPLRGPAAGSSGIGGYVVGLAALDPRRAAGGGRVGALARPQERRDGDDARRSANGGILNYSTQPGERQTRTASKLSAEERIAEQKELLRKRLGGSLRPIRTCPP